MTCETKKETRMTDQQGDENIIANKDDEKIVPAEGNTESSSQSSPKAADIATIIVEEEKGVLENKETSATPSLPSSDTTEKSSPTTQAANNPISDVQDTSSGIDITMSEKDVPAAVVEDDPWAIDGKYAKFLSQNKNLEVYYLQDEAKLIDTGFIMRSSGKGCDASNVYDEEANNANDVYYSDDEKERDAKNKKKGKKQQRNRQQQPQQQQQQSRPENYQHQQQQQRHNNFTRYSNAAPPPPPPQMPPYGVSQGQHSNLPQGFHNMASQHHPQGFQPQHSSYQYSGQFQQMQTSGPPPPPPPPPGRYHPNSYQTMNSVPTQGSSVIPPPPPPPRNPNEPPAYQYN